MDGSCAQVVVVVVLTVIAALFIALRLWAKRRRRTVGFDDLLIIIGLVLTLVLGIEDILCLWTHVLRQNGVLIKVPGVFRGHEGKSMENLNAGQVRDFFKVGLLAMARVLLVARLIRISISMQTRSPIR